MQKLTPADLQNLQLRQKGNLSPAYYTVANMEVGEILRLDPSDWNQKGSPSGLLRRIMKKYKSLYSIATIINQPGWIITRIA